jgi:hypothetical protein
LPCRTDRELKQQTPFVGRSRSWRERVTAWKIPEANGTSGWISELANGRRFRPAALRRRARLQFVVVINSQTYLTDVKSSPILCAGAKCVGTMRLNFCGAPKIVGTFSPETRFGGVCRYAMRGVSECASRVCHYKPFAGHKARIKELFAKGKFTT